MRINWKLNVNEQPYLTRREVIRSIGIATTSPLAVCPLFVRNLNAAESRDCVRFFFVTDTHYLAQKTNPSMMDDASARVCRKLVETLNSMQGEDIPEHAGGGRVGSLHGVIHGGDLVDSADKQGGAYGKMIATEFSAFEADYGLTGRDGLLKYPVYEVHGNHDGPQGDTIVVDGIKRRNKSRIGVKHVSPNGLHYSWDWEHVHFINLGIVVGEAAEGLQRRRYAPLESLAFLREDLAKLGDAKRPIVITQHIDIARYSVAYEKDEERFLHMEWHPQDVHSFYETIRPYNVIADFFGHTHTRDVYGWEGTSEKNAFTKSAVDVFNGDNASHFHGNKQAFFYVEILPNGMTIREVYTDDAWQTHKWSRHIWGKTI